MVEIKKLSKSIILKPISLLAKGIKLSHLVSNEIIYPFYHTINDDNLPHTNQLFEVKKRIQFEKELDLLLKYYEPISIDKVYRSVIHNEPIPKPSFHLTFDDGLRQCSEVIAPILKRKGIPATFFLNTAFIDNKQLFYRFKVALLKSILTTYSDTKIEQLLTLGWHDVELIDRLAIENGIDFHAFLVNEKPYLKSDQIRQLIADGFDIGSHSIDHPRFANISIEMQEQQIQNSFSFLEQNFGVKRRYFAFPFSDDSLKKETFNMLSRNNISLSFGTSSMKVDTIYSNQQRIPFDNPSGDEVELLLKKEYIYRYAKRLFSKNKISR